MIALNNRILLSEYVSNDETRIARIFHLGKQFEVELWDLEANTTVRDKFNFEDSAEREAETFVERC